MKLHVLSRNSPTTSDLGRLMAKSGKYRSFAALALLRLRESDLRNLHATVSEMSSGTFVQLIKNLEDNLNGSMTLTLEQGTEREIPGSNIDYIYHELNHIRRNVLRIPVQQFVDVMIDYLSKISKERDIEIPIFDRRRGLEAWTNKLVQTFSEQDVYHIAVRIRHKRTHSKGSDWKLR